MPIHTTGGAREPHEHARYLLGSASAVCGSVVAGSVLVAQTATSRNQILWLWLSTLLIALGWFVAFLGLSRVRVVELTFEQLTDEERSRFDAVGTTSSEYEALVRTSARRADLASVQSGLCAAAARRRGERSLQRATWFGVIGIIVAALGCATAGISVADQLTKTRVSCDIPPGTVIDQGLLEDDDPRSACWVGEATRAELRLRSPEGRSTVETLEAAGPRCGTDGSIIVQLLIRDDGSALATIEPSSACRPVEFELDRSMWVVLPA